MLLPSQPLRQLGSPALHSACLAGARRTVFDTCCETALAKVVDVTEV